ncbi:hypothetical protein CCACVL1_11162 [Corchorus capsularis]|uniref:Uncharacterized protein n=2 Tax=Corchorus TaxID=93758 RepID=A0A1R3IML7_COCAP|nr:hypothetical protein CCACVL1_11162 [Corchorus capsularis]OMP06964.1 hypothetical protein COLO4_07761 [Corchorus olitorius]
MVICVVLVVIAIGLVFGFGVFKNGFHKLKDTFHEDCDPRFSSCAGGRPFLGYAAPPPF